MPRNTDPISARGTHSPAKNIIGKNTSEPTIPAIRADGASADTSVPNPSIAAAPSTIASTKPPSSLGSGTEKAIRAIAAISTTTTTLAAKLIATSTVSSRQAPTGGVASGRRYPFSRYAASAGGSALSARIVSEKTITTGV